MPYWSTWFPLRATVSESREVTFLSLLHYSGWANIFHAAAASSHFCLTLPARAFYFLHGSLCFLHCTSQYCECSSEALTPHTILMLVSLGCCKKPPQMGWFKTTEIYSWIVWRLEVPKSRSHWGCFSGSAHCWHFLPHCLCCVHVCLMQEDNRQTQSR